MKKFEIKEAHSGTSKQEIREAKCLFKEGVESGKFYDAENVGIVFTDINCIIRARYIDLDDFTVIGEEIILC